MGGVGSAVALKDGLRRLSGDLFSWAGSFEVLKVSFEGGADMLEKDTLDWQLGTRVADRLGTTTLPGWH